MPEIENLLGFILGCSGVFCGLYGVREAFKPIEKSFFRDYLDAEFYAVVSFAAVVLGCVLTLVSVLPLVF